MKSTTKVEATLTLHLNEDEAWWLCDVCQNYLGQGSENETQQKN